MGTKFFLPLWFFSMIIVLIPTLSHSENYIIHMDLSAMPKAFSSHHNWYKATLSSALDNSQITTNNNGLISPYFPSNKLIYTYTNVMNGFSANLSPNELETLKSSPGYISSIADIPVKLHTTHSPHFLGLNPHFGAWPDSQYGEDVIIGVVDTGVWPESDSFKDYGLTSVPSKWKGQCENSIQFNSSLCNKKLIGAKFFNKGLIAKNPHIKIRINSTRDSEGHGTHTASTAAGSKVDGATFFGYANGTARGIAPMARVAVYKALWEDGAYSSDIIAAIDSAIDDGVDVLSLSFGFDERPLYTDPVAIATFAAMEKGIFVTTSAGNEGPFLKSLHNGTPWVITVAASTMDREFHGTLTLSNGVPITGLSLYPGPSTNHTSIVFMGFCNNTKELVKVKHMIVVCEDPNGKFLPEQVFKVDTSKVFGAVFITNSTESLFFLQNRFPSIIVNPMSGKIIKDYIKVHSDNARASMAFKVTTYGTKPAPSVDNYSARGPSYSCPFVLKPDITAPGTLILAAWPQNTPVMTLGSHEKLFSNFNMISGTSMACPHVAGVGALLKGAHPNWSPAALRSAIMTTSDILDNTFGHIKDISDGYKKATPLALGAGHVNPNKALDPGLVYNVEVQDYVNLLCALGFTQKEISAITRRSSNNCSNPSLDLNYPSFIAFFDANDKKNSSSDESRATQEFHRTVTNIGEGGAIYVASVTPIEGFNISVIPHKLEFKMKNEKQSYKLRIEGPKSMKKKIAFGHLTWTDVKHVVRSPIVVTSLHL